MSLARKCDLCGKFHDIYNVKQSQTSHNAIRFMNIDKRDKYFETEPIDCCPECMHSIKLHIEKLIEKKEENNNESISE